MSVIVYNNGVIVPQAGDDWEVKVDCVSACSKAPDAPIVLMEPVVKSKIDSLMKKYTNREWLGYFFGTPDKPYHILDMVIPEQVATGTRVDDVEFSADQIPEGQKVIGVIHSHHSMGANFSGTDEDFINGNHDISLLVAHSGMKCRVRYNVPCGAKIIKEAKIKINYVVTFNELEFLQNAEKNIKDRVFNTGYQYNRNWDDVYPFTGGNRTFNQNAPMASKSTEELFADLDKELSLEEELNAYFNPTQQVSDDGPVTESEIVDGSQIEDQEPGAGSEN